MRRIIHNNCITVTTLDGKAISGEEFLASPPIFGYVQNKKVVDDYAYRSSPTFRQSEKIIRSFERVEQRRRELELAQQQIKSQLDSLAD